MSLLPILIVPDPRLRQRARPVAAVDGRVRRILDDMLETMYEAPGIGLAAVQVGIMERLVVVDVSPEDQPRQPLRLINPEVTWRSETLAVYNEGCLSLPEHYADVTRPAAIKFRYMDESGSTHERDADGLLATCVQHEIDHLDGVLFIDHISVLKRNIILRKLQKAKKAGQI